MTKEDNRKRSLDDGSDGQQTKKSNYGKPLLKLLVPNFIAGKLIGKGGSNLSEIKTLFNGQVHVSSSKEFFPGTDERIMTICTDGDKLKEFISYMIDTLQVDKESEKGPLNTGNLDIKVVVTNLGAGLVIGKGGATIQSIKDNSQAKIYLSKREEARTDSERILVVSGTSEQRVKACSEVIDLMSNEPDKMCNGNLKYNSGSHVTSSPAQFTTSNLSVFNPQPDPSSFIYNGVGAAQRQPLGIGCVDSFNMSYEPKSSAKFYGQMEIPDDMVGAILGKQGQSIKEITHASGAKIKFSAKDEYVPGTTDRILTIRGSSSQIHAAYMIVDQKVAQVESDISKGVFTPRR